MTREIIARFPGKCLCGFKFRAGTAIKWSPQSHIVDECEWCRDHKRSKKNSINPSPAPAPRVTCEYVHEPWPFDFVWEIRGGRWVQTNEFLNT